MNDWTQSRSIERARDIPPQVTLTPPPPPPQPVVVDRVQFLQEQAEQRRLNAERERQLAERERQLVEYLAQQRARLQQAVSPYYNAVRVTEPFARTARERQLQLERQERLGRSRGSQTLDESGRPISTNLGLGEPPRSSIFYDAARAAIPDVVRDPVVRGVETGITAGYEAARLNPALRPVLDTIAAANRAANVLPGANRVAPDDPANVAAEAIVPREAWEVAIEFVPGIGTIPDLQRAVRNGVPEAQRALRQAMDTPAIRALQSERGALEPEKIPDAVKALTTRRRGKNVPIRTEEELQAAWEVLPPTYRQFIEAMTDVVLTPAERKAIVGAGRVRQGAKLRDALAGEGSTVERAIAGRAAQTGRIIPQMRAVGEKFTADQIDELYRGIDEAMAAQSIIPEEHPNAVSAMSLLLTGKRIIDPDKPLSLMPSEIKLLGRIYGPAFEAALPRTPEQVSAFQRFVDVANLPRAIISSFDVSAPGRQGIILAARNPEKWFGSMGPMFRSWMSEGGYERVIANVQKHRRFEEAAMRDIGLTDVGGGQLAEEPFASRLAHRIPIIRRSERAYSAYLNDIRISVADKGWTRLERTAQKYNWTPERLENAKDQWAAFVRHATGRGDIGSLGQYTTTFNALFFSPRFVISRPQAVWDMVKPTADPAVRQMVGENLGAFFAGGVSLLGLAAAAGAAVELDPRSTNFGKITIPLEGGGIQTIDFWGGFQPFARYAVQIATGQRKEQFTREMVKINRGETMGRFLRSKLSPAGAMGWDIFVAGGKTFEGDELTLTPESIGQQALDRVTPLVAADMIEAYRTGGLVPALTSGVISAFGGGVSTFEPSERQEREVISLAADKKLAEAGFPDVGRDFESNAEMRVVVAQRFNIDAEQARKFDSLDEMREFLYERDVPIVAKAKGVSEAIAKQLVSQGITNALSPIYDNAQKARLEWMRNNPRLAREAADAGKLGDLSKEEREILGIE